MPKSHECRSNISILLYEFYQLDHFKTINSKDIDADTQILDSETDIHAALNGIMPVVMTFKLLIVISIPFVIWKLQ